MQRVAVPLHVPHADRQRAQILLALAQLPVRQQRRGHVAAAAPQPQPQPGPLALLGSEDGLALGVPGDRLGEQPPVVGPRLGHVRHAATAPRRPAGLDHRDAEGGQLAGDPATDRDAHVGHAPQHVLRQRLPGQEGQVRAAGVASGQGGEVAGRVVAVLLGMVEEEPVNGVLVRRELGRLRTPFREILEHFPIRAYGVGDGVLEDGDDRAVRVEAEPVAAVPAQLSAAPSRCAARRSSRCRRATSSPPLALHPPGHQLRARPEQVPLRPDALVEVAGRRPVSSSWKVPAAGVLGEERVRGHRPAALGVHDRYVPAHGRLDRQPPLVVVHLAGDEGDGRQLGEQPVVDGRQGSGAPAPRAVPLVLDAGQPGRPAQPEQRRPLQRLQRRRADPVGGAVPSVGEPAVHEVVHVDDLGRAERLGQPAYPLDVEPLPQHPAQLPVGAGQHDEPRGGQVTDRVGEQEIAYDEPDVLLHGLDHHAGARPVVPLAPVGARRGEQAFELLPVPDSTHMPLPRSTAAAA